MATVTRNLLYGHPGRDDNEGAFDLAIEGDWPDDLDGWVFQVGPDRAAPGGHWFAGQALLSRVDCRPRDGALRVDFNRVETPLDRIRRAEPSLFRQKGVLEVSPFGFSNFGNTNVQWLGDRLFLGYDAGRPLEVDPETLELVTPVGRNAEWLQTLPGAVEPMIAVAAHPGADWEEGALYFANYEMIPLSGERGFRVCRWDLEGEVEHWCLEGAGAFDSIHDVKVTRDHVIVMDLPFVNEPMGRMPGPRRAVGTQARLWIVAKRDLRATPPGSAVPFREVDVPLMGGHMAVDFEEHDGRIGLTIAHHPMADLGLGLEPDDVAFGTDEAIASDYEGLFPFFAQPTGFGRYAIDPARGTVEEARLTKEFDPLWGGLLFTQNVWSESSRARARTLWTTSAGFDPGLIPERWWQTYAEQTEGVFVPARDWPKSPRPGALVQVDLEDVSLRAVHEFAPGEVPHPATFIPRRGAAPGDDADGYVLVLVHADDGKSLQLFDAAAVGDGPIARATGEGFNPPLGLHSTWAPRREGPRPSAYAVDAQLDAWETLQAFGANPDASTGIGRAIFDAS